MLFGTGIINPKSTKQKLNTKSSTEGELVGASDYLPNVIWTKMFLREQGYEIKENIFYQDNKSAILLERNGRNSCGPRSKHINIRYFFIKDRLKSEDIKIEHCPTDIMVADFFTKPLQGSLFRKFRDVILGLKSPSSLNIREPTTIQERVEEKPIISNAEEKPIVEEKSIIGDAEEKTITGKAKNIKTENKDIIQGGYGKKVSWSQIVRTKNKVPNAVLNKHARRFC